MKTFSALSRASFVQELQKVEYDLLVVGGGITGAGIALDAISRGLNVALVEKKDFAWGTSSRSTKLIHGGLRYLKQLEFKLVKEVGLERAIVYKNAKHIVRPERMLLPIVENGALGKTMSAIGLWVYDKLAAVKNEEKRKMLNKLQTKDKEPLLRSDILKGGGLYYEYRTDDARLTIENIKTAFHLGANCLNYMELEDYLIDYEGQINGAVLKDHISQNKIQVKAKIIVNATGPWVDRLRGVGSSSSTIINKRLYLTKGSHIVIPRAKLPIQQSVYFDALQDDRMLFAIPRGEITYIGTTDTTYVEKIDEPKANEADVTYILAATNHMFPNQNILLSDVVSTWAGLRPLIHEKGKSPSQLSRKDEIFYEKNGLITIAGGKLTGYRKMAERTVDVVTNKLQKKYPNQYLSLKKCQTSEIALNGNFESEEALERFIVDSAGEAKQILLSLVDIKKLVLKYGRDAELIIEKAYALYPLISDPKKRIHKAELWYAIHHEMSMTPADYLIRRTGRLYFERTDLLQNYVEIIDAMAQMLSWSSSVKEQYIIDFERDLNDVMAFRNKKI